MHIDRNFLRSTAIALAVAAASTMAAAQDAGHSLQGQVPGPNATQPQADGFSKDGKTQEQPVPGAMPGSDTVPSTISEKNAADDKLIIIAYTFKNLSDEERSAIFQALEDGPAGKSFIADIGNVLPSTIELSPMPREVVARVDQTKNYEYTVTQNKVMLVDPINRIVVAMLSAPEAPTIGAGGGAR